MGSTQFYPEEAPEHTVTVAAIAVERHPVTNAQFAEFGAATGYLTVAEQAMDLALYPGVSADDLAPGALVFRPTSGPVDLRDWRHPFGPDGRLMANTWQGRFPYLNEGASGWVGTSPTGPEEGLLHPGQNR